MRGDSKALGFMYDTVMFLNLLPSEGEVIAGLVEHQRRSLETHDMAKRLEALEKQLSKEKS